MVILRQLTVMFVDLAPHQHYSRFYDLTATICVGRKSLTRAML